MLNRPNYTKINTKDKTPHAKKITINTIKNKINISRQSKTKKETDFQSIKFHNVPEQNKKIDAKNTPPKLSSKNSRIPSHASAKKKIILGEKERIAIKEEIKEEIQGSFIKTS